MLNVCLKEFNDDIRISKWLSCVSHFLGDHLYCSHDKEQEYHFWQAGFENPPLVEILDKFIYEQANFIRNTSTENDSQWVESLKAAYWSCAPKNQCWNCIDGRIAPAVLRQNQPFEAPFLIRDCCGAPK